MKGQTEIIVFILITLISVSLVFSSIFWGTPLFQGSADASRLFDAENFIRNLDYKIQQVASNGGTEHIEFRLLGTLKLVDSSANGLPDDIIEFEAKNAVKLPEDFVYLNTENTSKIGDIPHTPSLIREIKLADTVRIQLFYRLRGNYIIDVFSDGNTQTSGGGINIESFPPQKINFGGKEITISRVRITFE